MSMQPRSVRVADSSLESIVNVASLCIRVNRSNDELPCCCERVTRLLQVCFIENDSARPLQPTKQIRSQFVQMPFYISTRLDSTKLNLCSFQRTTYWFGLNPLQQYSCSSRLRARNDFSTRRSGSIRVWPPSGCRLLLGSMVLMAY